VGEPRTFSADFGSHPARDPRSRFYDLALGGGALLDMGVYPLALALYLFGKPASILSQALIGETGVDEQFSAVLRYADGRLAACSASMIALSSCEAVVAGPAGHLRFHRQFWHSERLSLFQPDQPLQTFDLPKGGNGYNHELAEVVRCVAEGRLQSEVMSWQASRDLMWMMDTLRGQWGLRYPGE